MTDVGSWRSFLVMIENRARLIGDGFGVEVALAWPLVGDRVCQELIVAGGTQDRVSVTPERVFRYAIRLGASAVVLSHNHMTATGPSDADHAVTRRLVAAGHLLGVPLVASLVIEPDMIHDLVGGRNWPSVAIDVPTAVSESSR